MSNGWSKNLQIWWFLSAQIFIIFVRTADQVELYLNFCPHTVSGLLVGSIPFFFAPQGSQSRKLDVNSTSYLGTYWFSSSASISASSSPYFFFPVNAIIAFLISWRRLFNALNTLWSSCVNMSCSNPFWFIEYSWVLNIDDRFMLRHWEVRRVHVGWKCI